jgi:hypothetical protein
MREIDQAYSWENIYLEHMNGIGGHPEVLRLSEESLTWLIRNGTGLTWSDEQIRQFFFSSAIANCD